MGEERRTEREAPRRIGLSLSGGGFRASIFHLGVLKRLHELGILEQVTHISGVSGGAVIASLSVYLRKELGKNFKIEELERKLLHAVKRNPRTRWLAVILLRRIAFWVLPLWIRVPLERSLKKFTFDGFFRRYFFQRRTLDYLDPGTCQPEVPSWPILILNTTSLERGQDFFFTPTYIGPRQKSAMGLETGPSRASPKEVTIAEAVGASACVPGIFPPYTIPIHPDAEDDAGMDIQSTHLVDGGVFDNQGFKVFLTEPRDPHELVDYLIASDGSKTLTPEVNPLPPWYHPLKLFGLLFRSHSITEDRARWEEFALIFYKVMVGHLKQAAFFHTDTNKHEEAPYRLPDELTHALARLRTDFDSFSDLEVATLMYHGYTLVNDRIFNHCQGLLPTPTQEALSRVAPKEEKEEEEDKRRRIAWQKLVSALGGSVPGTTPLQDWPTFVRQVQSALPQPRRLRRIFLSWLEGPWRPFFSETDPTNPGNPAAYRASIAHIKRGATASLVWRGLQRLGDRGLLWGVIAFFGKTLVVLTLAYLFRELLIVLIRLVDWLIGVTFRLLGYAGWLNKLVDFVGSSILAILEWLFHGFRGK